MPLPELLILRAWKWCVALKMISSKDYRRWVFLILLDELILFAREKIERQRNREQSEDEAKNGC